MKNEYSTSPESLGQHLIGACINAQRPEVIKIISEAKNLNILYDVVNYEQSSYHNYTPAHAAAAGGEITILKNLKENGANTYFHMNTGSILHTASFHGQLNIVKFLVEDEKHSPLVEREDGLIPLNSALIGGRSDIVLYFLEGCDMKDRIRSQIHDQISDRQKNEAMDQIIEGISEYKRLADIELSKLENTGKVSSQVTRIQNVINLYRCSYLIYEHPDTVNKLLRLSFKACGSKYLEYFFNKDIDYLNKLFVNIAEYLNTSYAEPLTEELREGNRKLANRLRSYTELLKNRGRAEDIKSLAIRIESKGFDINEVDDFKIALVKSDTEESQKISLPPPINSFDYLITKVNNYIVDGIPSEYHYKIRLFEAKLDKKLQDSLHNDRIILQGLAQRKEDNFDNVLRAASLLGGTIQNHWIGFVGSLGAEGTKRIRDKMHEVSCKKARDFADLNIGKVTATVSKHTAIRYQLQIFKLDAESPDGLERLANYFHDKAVMKIHNTSNIESFFKKIGFIENIISSPESMLFDKIIQPGGEKLFLRLDERMVEFASEAKRRNSNRDGQAWNSEELVCGTAIDILGQVYMLNSAFGKAGYEKYGYCYGQPRDEKDGMRLMKASENLDKKGCLMM